MPTTLAGLTAAVNDSYSSIKLSQGSRGVGKAAFERFTHRIIDQEQRVRCRAVEQRQGDRRIRRMVDAALAFHDDKLALLWPLLKRAFPQPPEQSPK